MVILISIIQMHLREIKLSDFVIILSEKFRNFVAMRYGSNDLKEETIYFSGDFEDPIDSLYDHKDLGVTMSADGTFVLHIGVIKKVRQRIGWVCQTFKCRSLDFMRHIYIPNTASLRLLLSVVGAR